MKTVGDRAKARREELNLSVAEVALRAGLAKSTLTDLESGRSQGTRKIGSLAAALGLTPTWLETGKGERLTSEHAVRNDDFVEIPLYNARAAGGHGAINEEIRQIGSIAFKRRSLDRKGLDPTQLGTIYADGDSMNEQDPRHAPRQVPAVRREELLVKGLVVWRGGWV